MRPDDEPFLHWSPPYMAFGGLKMALFWLKMANHCRFVNIAKRSKRVQNGEYNFCRLVHLGLFQAKIKFSTKITLLNEHFWLSGLKIYFFLKGTQRVQMDPKWSLPWLNHDSYLFLSTITFFWIVYTTMTSGKGYHFRYLQNARL